MVHRSLPFHFVFGVGSARQTQRSERRPRRQQQRSAKRPLQRTALRSLSCAYARMHQMLIIPAVL